MLLFFIPRAATSANKNAAPWYHSPNHITCCLSVAWTAQNKHSIYLKLTDFSPTCYAPLASRHCKT